MLSPLFKVADFEVQEYNSLPVSITYQFKNESDKVKTTELFPIGSNFPSTKTITFENKKGGMDLLVHYSQGAELLPGHPSEVAKYIIHEGKPKHEKVSFILRISHNIHQIPCLETAELQEQWEEEEKIPVKKESVPAPAKPAEAPKPDAAADGDQPPAQDAEMKEPTEEKKKVEAPKQEFEIRKKQKKQSSSLKSETTTHSLPPQVRETFTNQEKAWFNED